jgi:MFS transporter, SP family, galactose:H+ symporter
VPRRDTGVISGALLFIGKDFHGLTSYDKELLTSILLIGALIGALVAGRIADRVGRRPTVLGTAALFVAGVLLAALSPSFGMLVTARVIIGLAVGSASMVVPLYIGEIVRRRSAARWSASTSWPSPPESWFPTWSTTGWPRARTGG